METRLKYTIMLAVWAVGILAVVVAGLLTDKLAFALGVISMIMLSWVKYNGKGLFS